MCPDFTSDGKSAQTIAALARTFREIGADEGTLWLLDEPQAHLVPRWNSGPEAARFVNSYRQPLERGLISLVCISEQSLCENQVYRNDTQDPTLDRKLGKRTCSMIAVPVRHCGAIRGVVSCVKLRSRDDHESDPPGFTLSDLETVAGVAEIAGSAMAAEA